MALFLAGVLPALVACASTRADFGPIKPEFSPSFEALEAAVNARERSLARRILRNLRGRPLGAAELRLADSFERILDGRDLLDGITFRLEATPLGDGVENEVPERPRRWLLSLVAENAHASALVLDLPPATLRRKSTVLGLMWTDDGLEAHDAHQLDTDHFNALDGFRLEAGAESRIELLEFQLDAGDALAVRDRWTLTLRSGEVLLDGESYPAQQPKVAAAEAVALARWLPTAPVEPSELRRYAGQPRVTTGALLERAVRIAPQRRLEALEALRELEPELDDSRLAELVPALRWLSGSSLPGSEARAWRDWLRYRESSHEMPTDPSRLELPSLPRR